MIYRSDDIGWDCDLVKLEKISQIFNRHGIKEMYAVVPLGRPIYAPEYLDDLEHINRVIGSEMISQEVVGYLKTKIEQGNDIALHSWKHTNLMFYSIDTVITQVSKYKKWLEDQLNYEIKYFAPPFNSISDEYRNRIEALGMKVLGQEGTNLEDYLDTKQKIVNDFCFYHWWNLDLNKLTKYLEDTCTHFV